MNHTKEEWMKLVLEQLDERPDENVDLHEIGSMYGMVPKPLKEAVEELYSEGKIDIVKDEKGKKWLRKKQVV